MQTALEMNSNLVIIQISDLHIKAEAGQHFSGYDTEQSFQNLLQHIHQQHSQIDLLLITGDLAQDPCLASYQRIYQTLKKYPYRSICLPGNHDELDLMHQVFADKTINCDRVIRFKHWQVICLNSKKTGSQGGYLAEEELRFLKQQLQKPPELNTLIAVHHHPAKTHSSWMDGMMIENNDELFTLLEDYPLVKAISCGHIHQVLQQTIAGIQVLGTPSTCFQFKPLSDHYELDNKKPGYRELRLAENGSFSTKIQRAEF